MPTAVVIPAYNEATRIAEVIRGARPHVDGVIVVVDGATDGTATVARDAGAIVYEHAVNCGAGAATMTGIEAARRLAYDVVVTIDADGQHDVRDIPRLLQARIDSQADLVIANRFGRKNSIPRVRRFANCIGNLLTFAVTGLYLPDTQCGFKVFGPQALSAIDLRMSGFEFCTEVIREAARFRWRIISVPTKVVYSEYTLAKGHSGVFASGIRTACKILLRTLIR